ncbi:MAG: type II secretion system minor pseudopilin GspK [Proteobacteria bacterium]|nr:type II secretion system minor pseudopilin GspK [Pseudomonadota bacterium]
MNAPARQRGVALIIALVLMALATILAVKVGFGGYVERKRTTSMLAAEQAYQFAMGAEALAADVLIQDLQNSQTTLAGPWAQTPPPIPLRPPNDPEGEPLGTLQGSLEDQEGLFNLNNLLIPDPKDMNKPDPRYLELFKRILDHAKVDEKWAQMIRDWIDADSDVSFPDGAEDAVYNSQTPPYLTGNWPMLSTSELLSLPDFGLENYRRLAPYVTALPPGTPINVCTAPGWVLDSITGHDEFTKNLEFLDKSRKSANGCFPDTQTLARDMSAVQKQAVQNLLSEKSDYFRLTTIVTLGTTEFTLYSLLSRKGGNRVTPILRSFGTT